MLASAAQQRARRRTLALAAGAAALAYYAHRQRWLARSRQALEPLVDAAAAYRDALRTSGQLASRLSSDVAAFLDAGGAAEVPASLRQLLRLAQCAEAQAAAACLGASVARGLASGLATASGHADAGAAGRQLLQSALDGVTSEQGRSVIACIAGAAARQAVVAALEVADRQRAAAPSQASAPDSDGLERVLTELDTDRGRRVASGARPKDDPKSAARPIPNAQAACARAARPRGLPNPARSPPGIACSLASLSRLFPCSDVVSALVRGAIGAYLNEAVEVDLPHQFLTTLSRPEHRDAVGDLAQRVTGEAVRVLVTAGAAELATRQGRPEGATPEPQQPRDAQSPGASSAEAAPLTTPPPAGQSVGARVYGLQSARCGPARRVFTLPSPPRGLYSPADGEPQPLPTPPPCELCRDGTDLLCAHVQPPRWRPDAGCGPLGGGGRSNGAAQPQAPPSALPDASWVSTARLALSLASQPEARALLRDVAGAAAGASVRALLCAVPNALAAAMPELPFRRQKKMPQAPPPQLTPRKRAAAAAAAAHRPATPSARLVELDADGRPLVQVDAEERSSQGMELSAAPLWRGLDQARVQGALALALFVHGLAFMPGAAARLGLYSPAGAL